MIFAVCQPPELYELLPLNVDVLNKTLWALTFAPVFMGLMGFNPNTRPAVS